MSRGRFTSAWGSATGPVKRFAPLARLYYGAFALCACLVCDVSNAVGASLCFSAAVFALAFARPPAKALGAIAAFGVVLLAPVFLLAPLSAENAGLAISGAIFAKGFCSIMVSFAAVSSLSASDFHDALAASFMPAPAAVIISQIERRAACMIDEAECVAEAIALRSGRGGARAALMVANNAPGAWMRRAVNDAERAASAMELRGFGASLPRFSDEKMRLKDFVLVIASAMVAALAATLRIWGAA